MQNNKQIVPYSHPVKDINYKSPKEPDNATKKVITELKNSWNNCGFVDDRGQIWIELTKLHSILRTNKSNANYYAAEIKEENKQCINNKTYILGYDVLRLMDKLIQEENPFSTKAMYLKYSEMIYYSIRECAEAKELRGAYQNLLKENRKKLKNARIKKYKIEIDELTGQPLKKIKSDFSHIRSFAIFKYIGDKIENGLIVNHSTHLEITKAGINDEEELLEFCKEKSWKTDWYDKYKKFLKTIE